MTYFKEIASGFWSLLAGMAVTIRYFVKPVVTVQYPRQKIEMSPAYRGYPRLLLDAETQTHRCIACEMCARICPSQLISVAGTKLPGAKQKVPYTYVHEHYYCSLCGLCVEVCPTTALEYSREYRLAVFSPGGCGHRSPDPLARAPAGRRVAPHPHSHRGGDRRGGRGRGRRPGSPGKRSRGQDGPGQGRQTRPGPGGG